MFSDRSSELSTGQSIAVLAILISSLTFGGLLLAAPSATPAGVHLTEGQSIGNPDGTMPVYADSTPSVGDSVLSETSKGLIHHRVISETESGYITKGDAATAPDQVAGGIDPLHAENIHRVALVTIPPLAWALGLTMFCVAGLLIVVNPKLQARYPPRNSTTVLIATLLIVMSMVAPAVAFEASTADVDTSEQADTSTNTATESTEGEFVYTAGDSDSTVDKYYRSNGTIADTFEVKYSAQGVTYYDENHLFVATSAGPYVLDPTDMSEKANVSTSESAYELAVGPDGYVYTGGSNEVVKRDPDTLDRIDAASIPVGIRFIKDMEFDSEGRLHVLIDTGGTTSDYTELHRINSTTMESVDSFNTGDNNVGGITTDDSGHVYVTNDNGGDDIAKYDGSNYTEVASITANNGGGKVDWYDGTIYYGEWGGDSLQQAPDDLSSTTQLASFSSNPYGVYAENGTVFVGTGNGNVQQYDLSTDSVEATYAIGGTDIEGISSGGEFDTSSTSTQTVSGRVTEQNGDPIPNATVKLVGVDYDNVAAGQAQTLTDRADELLDEAEDPLPDSWNPDLNLESQVIDSATSDDAYYPLIFTQSPVSGGTIPSASDLEARYRVPANKEIVLTAWNGAKTGTALGSIGQNEWDEQYPGVATNNRDVVLEQLSPTDEVLSRTTVEMDETRGAGTIGAVNSRVEFGTATLDPGIYRISVENSSISYTIVAGNPNDLSNTIEENLENRAAQLTDRAQDIRDKFQNNKFTRTTVTTNESGYWSADVGSSVNTVQVYAYKGPPGLVTGENTTLQDIRDYYNSYSPEFNEEDLDLEMDFDLQNGTNTINLSADHDPDTLPSPVYVSDPRESPRAAPPVDDYSIEVGVIRETAPEYGNISTTQEFETGREQLLENISGLESQLADAITELNATQQEIRDRLERTHDALFEIISQHDEVSELYRQRLAAAKGMDPDDVELDINSSSASQSELELRITVMRTSLLGIGDTIDTEETRTSAGKTIEDTTGEIEDTVNDTVSVAKTFESGDIGIEDVAITAVFTNGTATPVADEYITVDSGLAETEVLVEGFPLGDASAATFQFDVTTESDEKASDTVTVENPSVDARAPNVESVRFSTTKPGPNEKVILEVTPADRTKYGSLVNVSVIGPNDNTIATDPIEDGTTAFTTNGEGEHVVKLTYNDSEGNEYVKWVTLEAEPAGLDVPPNVRANSGPTGLTAVVGDGLESGSIAATQDGRGVRMVAIFADSKSPSDIAGPVDFYDGQLRHGAVWQATLELAQGEDRESIDKQVVVRYHTRDLDDDAIVYRNGNQPITDSGTPYGEIASSEQLDDGTVIKTYTTDEGQVTVTVNNDPSTLDRVVWRTRLLAMSAPLIGPASIPGVLVGVIGTVAGVIAGFVGRQYGLGP